MELVSTALAMFRVLKKKKKNYIKKNSTAKALSKIMTVNHLILSSNWSALFCFQPYSGCRAKLSQTPLIKAATSMIQGHFRQSSVSKRPTSFTLTVTNTVAIVTTKNYKIQDN